MSKKSVIGEGPEARAIIGHGVHCPRDVRDSWEVPELSLVQGLETQQVCRRAGGGGRTLREPGNSRGVVGQGGNGALGDVANRDKGVMVS